MFSIWILPINSAINFSVDGLANVFVKEQLDHLLQQHQRLVLILASTADQLFFSFNLWFKRMLSYNESIEA
jgi:hypothetical protein